MKTIEAKFKIVTPMFLHGADQTKAELRVPSIKGMLRFWWRAINYNDNINKVWENDTCIFGSLDQKVGQSRVLIHLIENKTSPKVAERWNPNDWKSYIGYGLTNKKAKDLESEKTEYLEPGGEFRIRVDINERPDKDIYKGAVNTLKVFGLLGGLGSRSRKGWGSMSLVELKADDATFEVPPNPESYTKELKKLLSNSKKNSINPEYTAFSNQTRIVISKATFDRYENAFKEIAEEYKNYKNKNEGFGLPRGKNSDGGRRSSPLFIHIHQLDNKYIWVCAFFKSIFTESKNLPDDGYKAVDDFVTKLIKNGNTKVNFDG